MPEEYLSRPRRRAAGGAFVAVLALFVAGLVGCSNKPAVDTANLPAGDVLVKDGAAAVKALKTAHVTLTGEGTIGQVPLRRADAILTTTDEAKGTIQIEQFATLVEFEFVVVNDKIHIKGPTGGWSELPLALASTYYDPTVILDPDKGVANIIGTAKEPRTEAKETVDGAETYKVAVKLDRAALDRLVPGIGDNATGFLWLDTQSKLLRKAEITVPGADGKNGKVTITATDFDAPVTISAP